MGSIILDDILGIQEIIVLMFVCCRGTDVVFISIDEDVWGSEDELTGALSDEVENWYGLYYKFVPYLSP